jgi:hypothetical protein
MLYGFCHSKFDRELSCVRDLDIGCAVIVNGRHGVLAPLISVIFYDLYFLQDL